MGVIIDAVVAALGWVAVTPFRGMLSQPAKPTKLSKETAMER
jgi:hypothetical protein